MSRLSVTTIEHGTPAYEETVVLRDEILRRPLGLIFTPEQLGAEGSDFHVACYDGEDLVGCLVLTPLGNDLKMRQVAVAGSRQGTGIGKVMVEFSERLAHEHGFARIVMNARETAVPFYEHLGYTREGERFEEVTIPHWRMTKRI